jgi:hypothetical protein
MLEPTNLPHAEVPDLSFAKGGPRNTQRVVSGAFWNVLRGGPDRVGPAPQDEGEGITAVQIGVPSWS